MTQDYTVSASPIQIGKGFVCWALQLLHDAAGRLRVNGINGEELSENQISQRLDNEMKTICRGRTIDLGQWAVRGIRTLPDRPDEAFEVDFAFYANTYPSSPDWYFAVEAKKVRGTGTSLAGTYVDDGVRRFVDGPYAVAHDYGVMLGYVIAPPVSNAVERVKSAMQGRADATGEISGMDVAIGFCSNPHTYMSGHQQQSSGCVINLLHLFVELA